MLFDSTYKEILILFVKLFKSIKLKWSNFILGFDLVKCLINIRVFNLKK